MYTFNLAYYIIDVPAVFAVHIDLGLKAEHSVLRTRQNFDAVDLLGKVSHIRSPTIHLLLCLLRHVEQGVLV